MPTTLPALVNKRVPPPRVEQPQQQSFSLSSILHACRQWWMIAIPLGTFAAALSGGLVFYFFEPVYRAEAWIRIDEHAPYIAYEVQQNSHRFVETQVGLIRSPLVLGQALSRPDIAKFPEVAREESPVDWLSDRIQVKPVGQSELYTIKFEGPQPENAAQIVNAVTEAYFTMQSQEESARTQRVIEVLEGQKERRSQSLQQLRETVRELSKQSTGKDPFASNPATEKFSLNHPLAALQDRLIQAEVEREILEAQMKYYEDPASAAGPMSSQVERVVDSHPEVQQLKSDLSALRLMLIETEWNAKHPEDSPSYRRVSREIETHETRLKDLRAKLAKETGEEMKGEAVGRRKEMLAQAQAKLASARMLESLLKDRYGKELNNVKTSSGQSLELVFALSELKREEKVFELIAERTLELRTEMRAPARVALLRSAVVPTVPLESAPTKKLVLAVMASLFFPFLLAILWERMIRRITDGKQLTTESNLSTVWEIASLPKRARKPGRRGERERALFEESVDSLRTGLFLSEHLRNMQVLAVTSAVSREGKTSLACELAISIAKACGEPTLLIDGDLRSPDVHEMFETRLTPGLAELLENQCSLKDAIITDWGQGVHLMPAGKLRVTPHKLLGNGGLKAALQQLRSMYRYIVIDTPPILPASESLVIAESADATILCTKRDLSRLEQVETAFERLSVAGALPVGAVLNDVPARSYLYAYGKYPHQVTAA